MSEAHVHLILTHVPVLGIVFGLLVLIYSWKRETQDALRIGLATLVLSGVAAAAVYLTGEAAEEAVEHLPGITHDVIEHHEEAAFVALVAAGVLGAVSAVALWFARDRVLPRWLTGSTILAAVLTAGIMAWTANLGAQINHPEIRPTTTVVESAAGERETPNGTLDAEGQAGSSERRDELEED